VIKNHLIIFHVNLHLQKGGGEFAIRALNDTENVECRNTDLKACNDSTFECVRFYIDKYSKKTKYHKYKNKYIKLKNMVTK